MGFNSSVSGNCVTAVIEGDNVVRLRVDGLTDQVYAHGAKLYHFVNSQLTHYAADFS